MAVLLGVVWLSGVALVAVVLVLRSPKRRKPVDELEAADAALRNRLVDIEDKFEHYVKRDSVRLRRAAENAEQLTLPMTREQRKAEVIRRWREQQGGKHHGAAQ